MPSHKEIKTLPYSLKQMFDLVMDIEKYPEFLPWCLAAKITNRFSENHLTADLVINFKGFTQKYSSNVTGKETPDRALIIDVVAIDGPFKNLINSWKFVDQNNQCQIEFFIDFEFKSLILEKMIGLIFEKATNKMIDAFETRAQLIYK